MKHLEIDRIELLGGLDADERARCLFEWGLVGDPDPQIEELSRFAETGAGEWSWRLGPDCKPPQRTRDQYNRELRSKRLGRKKAARPRPELEELPGTSHIDNPPVGKVPDPFASVGGRGDWATEGVRAHLKRIKAQEGKPCKPYANDPIVTKAQAAANTGNPFTDVTATRSSRLRLDEVTRVYDAMAFMRHAYQRRMNAHLTIRWGAIGVGEGDAQDHLDQFLNQAGEWFKRNKANQSCVWRDLQLLSDELLWVYVHEKSATYGFHTHVLLSMDLSQVQAFRAWVSDCLARLVRRPKVPSDTALLRRSYAKTEHYQDKTHWFWFKYITKQLDPDEKIASPFCDKVVPAREVFEPRNLRADLPVTVQRLVGICRRVDQGAQARAGYLSALSQGLRLYDESGFRIACLVEEQLSYYEFQPFPPAYPSLTLRMVLPNGPCEVAKPSALQYFWLQAAWDALEDADRYVASEMGGPNEASALFKQDEALATFNKLGNAINADRWDLMPIYPYDEKLILPKPKYSRTSSDWYEILSGKK